MTNNKRGGFTLIEMLVVVAIIGLLASVVVVGVGGARQKARDAKRVADLRSIQSYLEMNYSNVSPVGYPNITGTNYPASLPKDPSTGANYGCCVSTDKQSYILGTTLENAASRPSGGVGFTTECAALVPVVACSVTATELGYCISNK